MNNEERLSHEKRFDILLHQAIIEKMTYREIRNLMQSYDIPSQIVDDAIIRDVN